MQGHGWQKVQKISVPAGGTAVVSLPPNRPVLERLTIWASSGMRTLSNMTFQARANTKNYGASVNVTGARAADVVMDSGANGRLFAVGKGSLTAPLTAGDALEYDILLSNAGGSAEEVTLYFVGIGRDGGMNQ